MIKGRINGVDNSKAIETKIAALISSWDSYWALIYKIFIACFRYLLIWYFFIS